MLNSIRDIDTTTPEGATLLMALGWLMQTSGNTHLTPDAVLRRCVERIPDELATIVGNTPKRGGGYDERVSIEKAEKLSRMEIESLMKTIDTHCPEEIIKGSPVATARKIIEKYAQIKKAMIS